MMIIVQERLQNKRPIDDMLSRIRQLENELCELRKKVAAERISASGEFRVLICHVGRDRVALVQSSLREVVLISKLAPLPEAPPWVLGLLNLRGAILPVVDIQARLSGARRTPKIDDHVIVVEAADSLAGLVVTSVSSALEVRGRDVSAPPSDVPYAPYVIGILSLDGAPVPLLDPQSLLDASPARPESP